MSTCKQKKLALKISENISNPTPKPMGTLARESGYSKSASKRPSVITKSKGFQDILKKAGITDTLLTKRLKEGLGSIKAGKKPDMYARHRYLLTALELKGHIKQNENTKGAAVIIIEYGHRTKDSDSTIRVATRQDSIPA